MISEKQFLEYQKIIADIFEETGLQYDKMSDAQKNIVINISIELKDI